MKGLGFSILCGFGGSFEQDSKESKRLKQFKIFPTFCIKGGRKIQKGASLKIGILGLLRGLKFQAFKNSDESFDAHEALAFKMLGALGGCIQAISDALRFALIGLGFGGVSINAGEAKAS